MIIYVAKLVFPDEDGAAINITLFSISFIISAIWDIFFSCKASTILIVSPYLLFSINSI